MKNIILLAIGSIFCLWASSAIVAGIVSAGGFVSFASMFMSSIGLTTTCFTLVDFYTSIKGIEYIICAMFFVAFPLFFSFINKPALKVVA